MQPLPQERDFMNANRILEKKTILTAHAFDVQSVRIALPDGRERNYDLVDHAEAVSLLALNAEGEVYFVTQYRIGAEQTLLELPAGVMNRGEDPLESAHRELREEIGMDCTELIPIGDFFMTPGWSNEFMHCYLALGLFPSPLAQDDDEFLDVSRMGLAKAYQQVWQGKIQDGKTLATLLLAYPLLKVRFPEAFGGLINDETA